MRLLMVIILSLSFVLQVYAQDSTDAKDIVFEKVDVYAAFPGGLAGWRNYLVRNLNANVPVKNGAPAGKYTVKVQFIVDKDGSITDIKPLTNLGYGMEVEVVRILNKSGKWQPAIQGGRTVKAYHVQPVVFMVEDDAIQVISDAGMYTLFAGKQNTLTIYAGKVKTADLKVTIANGTVTLTPEGTFSVFVAEPGRARLSVYNNKNNKFIGEIDFEVVKR
jgi:ribosomal protein L23